MSSNIDALIRAPLCGLCILMITVFSFAQENRTVKVPPQIVQQLIKDENLREFIELNRAGSSDDLVAYHIDLNRDGKPELVVHGIGSICGANNCVNWIFGEFGRDYRMLLDAGTVQNIEPQSTFTNRYKDIIASMHGSAWDSDLTLYKFNGKQYRRVACYERTYRYADRLGRYRTFKNPRITPRKCQSVE